MKELCLLTRHVQNAHAISMQKSVKMHQLHSGIHIYSVHILQVRS